MRVLNDQSAKKTREKPENSKFEILFDFLSLCSYKGYKALKNFPASGLSFSYYNLKRIRYGRLRWIFQVMAHNCLWPFCSPSLLYIVCRPVS